MVQDALREMEEKGVLPEESWMDALKEASGSAFLGALRWCLARTITDVVSNLLAGSETVRATSSWLIMINHSIKQSNSVLMTFFLMMLLNQGAQEVAHAEIDAVVGKDRLPTMEDRPLLPYLDAIFRETMRYSPVSPTGESFHPLFSSCCSSSPVI